MAKDATTDFAAEIEDLISAAKKKPHNFCLMKAKEGVVLKAHPIRNADMMVREAKQAGGMSAFMTQGVLNVSGRTLRFSVEDVPRSLPKAMKQYLIGLKVKCKLEFVLPSGEIVGEDGSVSSGAEKGPDGAPGATPEQAAAAPDARARTASPYQT